MYIVTVYAHVSILGFPGGVVCGLYCHVNVFVVLALESICVHVAMWTYIILGEVVMYYI